MWLRLTEAYRNLQEMQEIEIQSWKIHLTIYWPFYDCDLLNVFRFTHSVLGKRVVRGGEAPEDFQQQQRTNFSIFTMLCIFHSQQKRARAKGSWRFKDFPFLLPFCAALNRWKIYFLATVVFLAFPWRCHVLGERKFINVINNIYSFSGEEEGERKVYGIRNWNRQVWYLRYAIHGEV